MSDIRDENQPFTEGQSVWLGLRRGQVLACAWRDEGWTALVEWQSGHISREHCDSLSASDPLVRPDMRDAWPLMTRDSLQIALSRTLDPTSPWASEVRRLGTPDFVAIPRARYNYLLEVEHQVLEFTESFTRWEA